MKLNILTTLFQASECNSEFQNYYIFLVNFYIFLVNVI